MKAKSYWRDLTDKRWKLISALLPASKNGNGPGRPREINFRDILNAIFYLLRTGCQ